ncbi:alanine--tRNA ligase [Oligella ureolytica]
MNKQREMARASGKLEAKQQLSYEGEETLFEGYEKAESTSTICAQCRG